MEQKSDWERFKENPEGYAKEVVANKPVRPWDFVFPSTEYADKETSEKRLDICKACPFVIKATTQCKKCKCFMHAKTKLAKATCPVGKW